MGVAIIVDLVWLLSKVSPVKIDTTIKIARVIVRKTFAHCCMIAHPKLMSSFRINERNKHSTISSSRALFAIDACKIMPSTHPFLEFCRLINKR